MADVFIEQLVARKRSPLSRLIGTAYIFVLVLITALTFMLGFFALVPAVLAVGIWLVVRLIKSFDKEFEYIVTNGEMDVDRIVGKSKRKRLLTINSRSFEIIAPDEEVYFSPYKNTQFKERIDASSGAGSRYFAIGSSKQGGKLLLYFEPNERMLEAFKMYNPRAVKQ
jgi:hypothetical protein